MRKLRVSMALAVLASLILAAFAAPPIRAQSAGEITREIEAPELPPGLTWLNSEPLRMKELRGKVVLVDFWEYTCVNCIRTLPYVRTWWDRYKDKGLVIVGVHTPEFQFAREKTN